MPSLVADKLIDRSVTSSEDKSHAHGEQPPS
jgi:hypothetical protein